MAERLSKIERKIESIEQLSAIVSAYRGIAAARLHEAEDRLDGIRSHAATIAGAIGQLLGLRSHESQAMPLPEPTGPRLVLALCSEQGFVGSFNSRVLDETQRQIRTPGERPCKLFVIGDRGLAIANERGVTVDWSAPMAAHADEATALGDRLVEALYAQIEREGVSRAMIVHAVSGRAGPDVVTRQLIPFAFERFSASSAPLPPLINLPLPELVGALAQEYVFAELCEAVMLSYEAENEARMMAMLSARTNVADRLAILQTQARLMRQQEITAEVVELAAGVEAET